MKILILILLSHSLWAQTPVKVTTKTNTTAATLLPSTATLKTRPLAERANECQLCHIKRKSREVFIPKKNATQREHFEIQISHGSLKKACNDCHDPNNSNMLYTPATFTDTSPVCFRCHEERVEEWRDGRHGKKVGSWKNRVVYQCIECHNPHSVSFKKMQSKPKPKFRNPLGSEKSEKAE